MAGPAWRPPRRAPPPAVADGPPLQSGWVGWFGYEAGAWMDRQPPPKAPPPLPVAWLGRAEGVAAWDRRAGAWVLAGAAEERGWLAGRLAAAEEPPPPAPPTGRVVHVDDPAAYLAGVRRVLRHLHDGDAYQVNLARELRVADPGDPFDAWRRLRRSNPARRAALIETADGAVVCNSPELLLAVRGRELLSVPIKGTAPAAAGPRALLRSAKERAELRMIVDLVRADLGRVARPGTVRWGRRRVGRVGHVWHAMQRVRATLDEGHDALDAFAAVFPAGSVTGAPRVAAMEILHRLEPGPRGVYCGSLGWFGDDGDAWWNVAIRTLTFAGGLARLHVGAGLVVGSDARRELAETELKAERLLRAVVAGPA